MQHTPFSLPYPVRNGESIGFINALYVSIGSAQVQRLGLNRSAFPGMLTSRALSGSTDRRYLPYAYGIRFPLRFTQLELLIPQ